jgi:hypothetical protein
MTYIYLSEDEAINESYTIAGLTNGTQYYVRYTQVQVTPDGTPYSSNTQNGIPCNVPDAVVVNGISAINTSAGTASVSITFGASNGSDIEQVVVNLLNETSGQITTQRFTPSTPPVQDETILYTLIGLTINNVYVLSAQVVNSAGYSAVSNSVEFEQSYAPAAVTITSVVSGYQSYLQVTAQAVANPNAELERIYFQYKDVTASPGDSWSNFGYVSALPFPADGRFTVNTNTLSGAVSLTNGIAYYVRAYATNAYGNGATGNENMTGIPIIRPVVTNPPSLSVNILGQNLTATYAINAFAPNACSFAPPLVACTFYGPGRVPIVPVDGSLNPVYATPTGNTGNTAQTTTTGLDYGIVYSVEIISTITVPPSVVPYWMSPALLPGDKIASTPVEASASGSTIPDAVSLSSISRLTGRTSGSDASGVIQLFWQAPADGFSPIQSYDVYLYKNVYPVIPGQGQFTIGSTEGDEEYITFQNLQISNSQYWFTIRAVNENGNGPWTVYPYQTNGIFIDTDTLLPVTNLSATQLGQDPSGLIVEVDWTANAQAGYTLQTFDVYRISSTGVQTLIRTVTAVVGQTQYSIENYVSINPGLWTYGVVTNALYSGFAVRSTMNITTIQTAGTPVISSVGFSINAGTGFGTITFYVDRSGGDINTDGIMYFVPPLYADTSANPVNILDEAVIAEINDAPSGPFQVSQPLGYRISPINTPYLISASNGVGSTYVSAGLY